MTNRAKKIAAFGLNCANVLRAKTLAATPSGTNNPVCLLPPIPQVRLPVPRYMLTEQAHIHEFGYSH